MRLSLPSLASETDQPSGSVTRDRLETFRWLFFVFGLFALVGTAITLDFGPLETTAQRIRVGVFALGVAVLWIHGHRRRAFARVWLPFEAAILMGFTATVNEPVASLAVYFIGVQFRALYGTRRDAWFLAFAYGLAFVFGVALSSVGIGAVTPVVLVGILALGFCSYVLHTLKEVLERDQQRATDLRRSEDRYRLLFDNNPWPMWVVDPESLKILDVNRAAIEQYGYSRADFLSMSLRDLRSRADLEALEQLRPEIQSDRRFTHLTRHKKRDGTIIDVEVTADTVEFDGRRARIALAVDVSKRQRAEQALRASEQRFRSVAENLREALMITDGDDRITLANSRVRDVLGYEPEEVIGKIASELLLPPTQSNVFRDRMLSRFEGKAELYETELLRKDGSRIFAEVSASPYRDESGRVIGTLGAISDISERRGLEDRLRQAMRMEAVGQLAGGVAHDFNNLLTVIKCHTELLREELRADDPRRVDLFEIERAASRGAMLTQQLLAFGRKQLLQPRRVSLVSVVTEMAPRLRRTVGPNVKLITLADPSTGDVHADALQLEYVLTTMVKNANEAMPKGGRITIQTESVELLDTEPHGATQEVPIGRYALLSVADDGVGMEHDVMTRVFEPFFTTKGPGEGSGLGLASAYGVIRQSGGFVDVESTPNVGTTFRIYLPLATAHGRQQYPKAELQTA